MCIVTNTARYLAEFINIDKHNLYQDFVKAIIDEQLWEDLLVSVESFCKGHDTLRKRKNNEKIKMLLETFDDANLINVQKEDE